jgi:hypothetical protein
LTHPRSGLAAARLYDGRRQRPGKAGSAAAAWILLCALAGCAFPEPWVKPYERERLADPIMQFSRSALPDRHTTHVREVREGSRGATGVQGGGCGCN